MEREHVEDLLAEGRARYETARLRAAHAHLNEKASDLPKDEVQTLRTPAISKRGRAA
jgi:hypothetical protein